MPRNTTSFAVVAVIVIAAATMAALAGRDIMRPVGGARVLPPEPAQRVSPSADTAPVDRVVGVARRFALAARNWTPTTYRASWERQIRLAGGRYRRALIAGRPGRRDLAALREDGAESKARVLRIARDGHVRPPAARVLVTLDEITTAGGQTVRGTTLNEVRLLRQRNHWRVVGWTVVPGGGGRAAS